MPVPPLPGQPAQPDVEKLVYLGMLTKPHGVRGGIRMHPEFDDLDDFEFLKTSRLFIKAAPETAGLRAQASGKTGQYRQLELSEFQPHQRSIILYLDGISDMTAAEALRGYEVFVYEDELWDLPEGKYYTWQLVGLSLFDETTGASAGTVTELRPGVQDYLVVKGEAGEFLVPYVPEIVKSVNLEEGRIVAELPPGLTEI